MATRTCKRGIHELTGDNIVVTASEGLLCKACRLDSNRRASQARRERLKLNKFRQFSFAELSDAEVWERKRAEDAVLARLADERIKAQAKLDKAQAVLDKIDNKIKVVALTRNSLQDAGFARLDANKLANAPSVLDEDSLDDLRVDPNAPTPGVIDGDVIF